MMMIYYLSYLRCYYLITGMNKPFIIVIKSFFIYSDYF